MRFIDNSTIKKPDPDWDNRANAAKNEVVNNGSDTETYRTVWTCCKEKLAEQSHEKCWYCEIIQERSDDAVDHFRPRSKYKWLAFDFNNFRYSCTFCNSRRRNNETGTIGGKGDKFPLMDERQRAISEGQEENEQPILLDPCKAYDPALLDFLVNGKPTAKYPAHQQRKKRAETSINLYHLDHEDLVEKRRVLAVDLNNKINTANKLFDRVDKGDTAIDDNFNEHVRSLAKAMSETAELCSFARCVIRGRRDIEWVQELLDVH